MNVKRSKTVQQYHNEIARDMKELGVYRAEFARSVGILARMLFDYSEALQKFEDSGGSIVVKHTNKAGATNAVKNPYYLALEGLRQSILEYLRELGLTPSALKKINESSLKPTRPSALAEVLKGLGG